MMANIEIMLNLAVRETTTGKDVDLSFQSKIPA